MGLNRAPIPRWTVIATLFINMFIGTAGAETWHVEQDGSGDWTTLQQATDAAAHGDTILVGPGRYEGVEVTPWAPSHYQKTLTYIGENVDSVIVGPDEYQDKAGMWIFEDVPQHFRNMTFENLRSGISFRGGTVESCRFIGCLGGVVLQESNVPSSITDCTFKGFADTIDIGSSLYARIVGEVLMEDCLSEDMKITAYFVEDYVVRNCRFPKTKAYKALLHHESHGLFEGCEISGYMSQDLGTLTIRGCEATVNDTAGRANLGCANGEVVLENSVLHGGSVGEPTIIVGHDGWVHGSGNHILKSEEASYVVRLLSGATAGSDCDLRNNYWGTDEGSQISEWILDAEDDPSLQFRVLYEPFSSVPLSTGETSFGSLKSMFR